MVAVVGEFKAKVYFHRREKPATGASDRLRVIPMSYLWLRRVASGRGVVVGESEVRLLITNFRRKVRGNTALTILE